MSRMRQRGNDVRFIMVSATVPNIEDIAAWVRLDPHSSAPAKVFEVYPLAVLFFSRELISHT